MKPSSISFYFLQRRLRPEQLQHGRERRGPEAAAPRPGVEAPRPEVHHQRRLSSGRRPERRRRLRPPGHQEDQKRGRVCQPL